ncbi:hypothetical protein UFOVP747_28 [uncultured Caudovirales phage]|uniref:Uncharacterized protein n=1 Tax=uncultured Caudovirales phage TaxID=2100421 RepID=A0A6J7XCD0_9CAUD|nr:hypothetical protein UFOVP675_2 [uncultured Caudovirales phage]CAB5225432.1 hypothetical protein UFOVP747_28 [uncultured Caudovirales phage]
MKRNGVVRAIAGGPGPNGRQAVVETLTRLRRADVRAVACVLVGPNGGVQIVCGGAAEGHGGDMLIGLEGLRRKIMEDVSL